jgi:hypothetical protein
VHNPFSITYGPAAFAAGFFMVKELLLSKAMTAEECDATAASQ